MPIENKNLSALICVNRRLLCLFPQPARHPPTLCDTLKRTMRRASRYSVFLAFAGLITLTALRAQPVQAPDITKTPTLYVVPYAHLDTQWRWEFPQSIGEYLLKTMRVNFDLIDKYPHYIFN